MKLKSVSVSKDPSNQKVQINISGNRRLKRNSSAEAETEGFKRAGRGKAVDKYSFGWEFC